jgi:hypothetical protein
LRSYAALTWGTVVSTSFALLVPKTLAVAPVAGMGVVSGAWI